MEQRARLNVDALNEVTALAFSPDGTVLLSVSGDENNTITLTEWATGTKLAVARGGGNEIYGLAFNTTSKKPPKHEAYRKHAIEVVQLGNNLILVLIGLCTPMFALGRKGAIASAAEKTAGNTS